MRLRVWLLWWWLAAQTLLAALPELFANSTTPGEPVSLSTLKAELSEAGTEFEIEAAELPEALRKVGQYRVRIEKELMLCEGKAEKTKKVKVLERGIEGTTKVAHAAGKAIWHEASAAGIKNIFKLGEPEARTKMEATLEEKEHEVSATRDALVCIEFVPTVTAASNIGIFVGATEVTGMAFEKSTNSTAGSATIPVPAGKKWKVKKFAGNGEVYASVTFLN